ncbi:MAG: tRNA (N6-threonylcarbamoyladenosine(37)-N6)-methyltransferase TrmO [Candidatus Nanopelagicales bacterium]
MDDLEATADLRHAAAGIRADRGGALEASYQVRPIGWIESPLIDAAEAPKQGEQGAPDAWLVLDPAVRDGARDLAVGSDLVVLTWLHRARRDELVTHPGGDPTRRERGVFSTRSPARPNPVGIHRVAILAIDGDRLRIGPIEAIDGTPVIDLKPVLPTDRF